MQNEVAAELIQQEYEVYIVRDHQNLTRVLKRYPDSIVLVNIDDRMSEGDWETWIKNVMTEPATSAVQIGILSANSDEVLQRKYINSVKVQCGYTIIKSDISKSVKQLLDILKVINAKGRRKYIRATSENEALTTLNLPHNGAYINGVIKDISVVGLSCVFSEDPALEKNSLCSNIQIKLQSMLLKAEGIVFGSRMDGLEKIYVILFTQRIDPDV
ncbi:MAG: pilus assembly protein PilZ, partial [Treponema sp.]|nr:pilus assembly protein PilZ [Treponema sp.]